MLLPGWDAVSRLEICAARLLAATEPQATVSNLPTPLLILGAAGLFLFGLVIGWWFAKQDRDQRAVDQNPSGGGDDRETVLQMLSELDDWTQQYSGDVSQHQTLLASLSDSAAGDHTQPPDDAASLLEQVVQSNNQLRQKLHTAEHQLERKSQEIKDYLTQARTDALTGLANRRELDQQLEQRYAQYRAGGQSFVVALVDIDHFKAVNDRCGHAEGDQVLKDFAASLARELNDAALVARFGGEEFAVIFDTPLRESAKRMDQVRQSISRHRQRSTQHQQSAPRQLTISVGLSQPLDDMGAASIVRRADQALYAAKRTGRNRVYFHDGGQPTLASAPEVVS